MNETAAVSGSKEIVESAWRDQATWSETANRLKAHLMKWRNRAAVAGVLGAFLETFAAVLPASDGEFSWLRPVVALAGAVILAVVPYVLRVKASKDQVRSWVRARSASEALKETIYRYLVGAPPYGPQVSPSQLVKACHDVKEKVQDLWIHAASVVPLQKSRPLTLDIDGYVKSRVNNQVENYYRPRGLERAIAAGRLHNVEFWLGMFAAALGAAAGASEATGFAKLAHIGPWVAVVTTAGAAVTAHLAASRYDHEAMIYFGTADRLTALRDEWLTSPDRYTPESVARFVDDCEHAISTENEGWLAKWSEEKADA